MTLSARFNNFTMMLPEKGPMSVPDKITFTANVPQEIDLSQLIDNGWMDYISGVYVDNISNAGDLTFVCNGTNQRFFFPAGCSGYFSLFLPNPPKVTVTSSADGDATFQWYNVPVFPMIIQGPNATTPVTAVDIASVGGTPVTDPLSVDTGLTQGLTDTQLRASNVDVRIATTTGAAYTDRSIANLSGASQTLMASNSTRRFLMIANIANNNMAINLTGGAAAIGVAGSLTLAPGAAMIIDSFCPTSAITIIGTVNDDVTAYEI